MKFLLSQVCCLFPISTFLLIVVPVLFAKYINIPPEHRTFRKQVRKIEREYRWARKEYEAMKSRNRVTSLAGLRRMKPLNFERHIANLFKKMGYRTQITPRTADDGVDIIAIKTNSKVVIQCKRYANKHKVGSPDIRNFIGAMELSKSNYGYFVTTSTFTEPARKTAARKNNLTLVNGSKIIKWWEEYKIGPYATFSPPQKQPSPPKPATPLPPPTILKFTVSQWITLVLLGQILVFTVSFLSSILNH